MEGPERDWWVNLVARAALTAAILTTMATPATAHPTMEHYVEDHTHDVLLPSLLPNLESRIELELEAEAREEWREIDRRYDARQRRLERERETRAVAEVVPSSVSLSADWQAIAFCESSGNWELVTTGNGYWFALQFDPDTWVAYGGDPAYLDGPAPSPEYQIAVAERVAAAQGGENAWPTCWWEQ